ncbi:MAG TPA: hypothetical protein VFE37_07935 [Chloroflexota bacterium]|nr:hypothetical protein [Chloroflexota bacterium]
MRSPAAPRSDPFAADAPPDSAALAEHPALRALGRRLYLRGLLRWGSRGLLAGLVGAALLALVGRLAGQPAWPLAAVAWGLLAPTAALAAALARRPDLAAVARAADGLGLDERVSSTLYAARVDHPAARLLAADASRALARLRPADYAVLPEPRLWRAALVATAALGVALLAPLPLWGDAAAQAADAEAIATARRSVQALEASLTQARPPEPLAQAAAAELAALDEELLRARSVAEATRAVEESQERLAGLLRADDYAWRRALEGLASAWNNSPELSGVAQALAARDPAAIEQSLADAAAGAGELSAERRQQLSFALQAGANAARDVPALASGLRQAAAAVGAENGGAAGAAGALASLAPSLAEGAGRATGLQATQRALSGLGQVWAALCPPGSGPPTLAGRGGTSAGSAATGTQPSASSGSGGAGAGPGAGAGGEAARGRPSAASAGATLAGGSAEASVRGPTAYEAIYAPSLLGGAGGPQVAAPGDVAGASGESVALPDAPVALGAVRPYDEVYGQYEAAARQSLVRQALPPALQGLVQRYFSALAPEPSAE